MGFVSLGLEIFQIWGFLSRGLGIFLNLGILIPRIGDSFKSGDFNHGDRGFLKSGDFYPRNYRQILGIFTKSPGIRDSLGIFNPRDFLGIGIFRGWGCFFVGWDSWEAEVKIYSKTNFLRLQLLHHNLKIFKDLQVRLSNEIFTVSSFL